MATTLSNEASEGVVTSGTGTTPAVPSLAARTRSGGAPPADAPVKIDVERHELLLRRRSAR